MKNRIFKPLVALALFLLGACAVAPKPEELAAGQRAVMPASEEAAQAAVVSYFAQTLKDPESARYTYRELRNGWLVIGSARQFGWFMCGTVNAKNSYGGYVGAHAFIAYFDPYAGERVVDGSMDSGRYVIVGNWCRQIYGS
jgi:hypothetical protein